MQESKINKLLNQLESKGLLLKEKLNSVTDIEFGNEQVKEYFYDNWKNVDYIIGSVPSSLESIGNIDYAIGFESLESIFAIYDISPDLQTILHQELEDITLDEEDDINNFIKRVKRMKINKEFKSDLFKSIDKYWKKPIINELREILEELNNLENSMELV
ncbi:hypothetical protein Bp8pS_010 [Bacillus phage vB_BpuM-BpSp]|nr:hypothetical protein Bp8pS_010 [Bacillus phage vB_BpuM-BpSp]